MTRYDGEAEALQRLANDPQTLPYDGGPYVRVVTPEQLEEGYLACTRPFHPGCTVVERRKFEVIRRFDDGNYLVKEPGRVAL